MKILLCTPMFKKTNERWMPLGLCYVAAMLQKYNHEVRIFDRYVVGIGLDTSEVNKAMCEEIKSFRPDIIGFSTYTPVMFDTISALKAVKTIYNGIIVLGGHHSTTFPELTLKRIPEADMVIAGEGELSFSMLANGENKESIPGLYWRHGDEILRSDAKVVRAELDELPLPAYELLDMDFYTKRNIFTVYSYFRSVGCMISARGCNNRCSFCTESLTFSGGVCAHNTNYVINNIRLLTEKYGCTGITFYDNNFLADKSRAKKILNAVIDNGLNKKIVYCIQARADDIDEEIASLMKKAGFNKVEIGVETYNQDILNKVGKNTTISATEKAFKILRHNEISTQANLIMGFKDETIAVLESTRKWVKKLKADNIKWSRLHLYPGTLLYNQSKQGEIENSPWTKDYLEQFFNSYHISELPDDEREKWVDKKLKPFQRWIHHKGIIKRNSVLTLLIYYLGKIGGRWK